VADVKSVVVRFFAAARSAAGTSELTIEQTEPLTITSALQRARTDSQDTDSPNYAATIARCTFLVNGVATSDRDHPLDDGDVVDVLPPFAGG
jgi:sulfur-carrier protein